MSPLITVAELAALRSEVTILDVRYRLGGPSGREEYAAGHIPGAVYIDLDVDLASPPGARGRHPLPAAADFQAAMRRAGVGPGPVVVYDDWQGRAAARAWWLLGHHGHRDVRVLDGGWAAWCAAGLAREAGVAPSTPGDFVAVPGNRPVLEVDQVLDFAATHCLIDARQPERFSGAEEPVDPVARHIPGAVNVPTSANLTESGHFRPAMELAGLYPVSGQVGVYCGSGVTATHDILALSVLGIEASLYPGSWSEWVTDPTRPVAQGR